MTVLGGVAVSYERGTPVTEVLERVERGYSEVALSEEALTKVAREHSERHLSHSSRRVTELLELVQPGLRTRHTLEPLAWHWSHWPGRLVNRGGKCLFSKGRNPVPFSRRRP